MLFILFGLFIILLIVLIALNLKFSISKWLFFTFLGLALSLFAIIVYSVYLWDTSYLVRKVLGITNLRWIVPIYYLSTDAFLVNRIFNTGIAMFFVSAVIFSIEFLNQIKKSKIIKFKMLFFIPPLFYVLFYDPYIVNMIYDMFFVNSQFPGYENWLNYLQTGFRFMTKLWMIGYLIFSAMLLLESCRAEIIPPERKKNIILTLVLCDFYLLHSALFYWIPRPLVLLRGNIAMQHPNYWGSKYALIKIMPAEDLFQIIFCMTLISFFIFLYLLIKKDVLNVQSRINRKLFDLYFNIADMGSRLFIHSIKNDIFAMQSLILSLDANKDTKEFRRNYSMLLATCANSIQKLNDLNLRSREIKLDIEETDMNQIIRQVFDEQCDKHQSDAINFDFQCQGDIARLFVDVFHIKEAIRNLIINGLEAMAQSGGTLSCRMMTSEKWLTISISDTGVGIDKKDKKKLFQPFFSMKSSSKNWGIGLAYCKRVALAHGGDIIVNSAKNQGSTFIIYLPKSHEISVKSK